MTTYFATKLMHGLGFTLLLQAGDAAGGGQATTWLLAVIVLAVAALGWIGLQLRRTLTALNTMRAEHAALQEANRALADRERKQTKSFEATKEELRAAKHDLGTQRKKTHAAQEEAKRVREGSKEELRRLDVEIKAKTAFVESHTKEAPSAGAPKPNEPAPKPVVVVPAPAPAPKPAEPSHHEAEQRAMAQEETSRAIAKLERDVADLRERLSQERSEAKKRLFELKQARRRVEQFRRVDLMTKNRVEILQDKIKTLGREYYNTVSELALLKGDVRPLPREVFGGNDDDISGAAAQHASPDDSDAASATL